MQRNPAGGWLQPGRNEGGQGASEVAQYATDRSPCLPVAGLASDVSLVPTRKLAGAKRDGEELRALTCQMQPVNIGGLSQIARALVAGAAAAGLAACNGAAFDASGGDVATGQLDAQVEPRIDASSDGSGQQDATVKNPNDTTANSDAPASTSDSDAVSMTALDAAAPDPPCDKAEKPSSTDGIFVSANSGNDESGNGSEINPVKTVAKGLQAASAASKAFVYLDVGTYSEKVVFTSGESGVQIRGGFKTVGATWERDCDARKLTLLKSPQAVAVEVTGTSPTSGLRDLTVTTKAVGATPSDAPGESVYGIRVTGAGAKFSLVGVVVISGGGGAGGVASPGTTPPAASGTCATACSDGAHGTNAVVVASAPTGAFTANGYVPSDGPSGVNGGPGHNGAAGAPTTMNNCTQCTGCGALHCYCACAQAGCGNSCDFGNKSLIPVTTAVGACGCAGAGAIGGRPGRGGGAAVALFVSGGATVSASYSSLTAGVGGDGASGGAGVPGALGSDGAVSSSQCAQGDCTCSVNGGGGPSCGTTSPPQTVSSAQGVKGGGGGTSGKGGGGAGGPSFGAVLIGGASLIDDHTVLAGSNGGLGADGAAVGARGSKLSL